MRLRTVAPVAINHHRLRTGELDGHGAAESCLASLPRLCAVSLAQRFGLFIDVSLSGRDGPSRGGSALFASDFFPFLGAFLALLFLSKILLGPGSFSSRNATPNRKSLCTPASS